jgi:hypothetical protein
MLRAIHLIFSFCITGLFIQSKEIPDKTNTYTVYINYEDYSVRANVLYNSDKIKTKMFHTYYWYMNNDIKKTEGGFDGKLLHGEYKSFFRNLNLKEEGNFKYGLKDGIWKTWYLNGKIHELINYKNGLEQGQYKLFDEQGYLISETDFRNGKKNGKEVFYKENKTDSVIIYKNGQLKQNKPAKTHLKANKSIDPARNKPAEINKAKDTVESTPKSSFKLKNIFNKKEKKPEQTKPGTKKETKPEKKNPSAHGSNQKG